MSRGGGKGAMVACLAVLLGARIPGPEPWMGAASIALAGLLGFAALGGRWGPLARLRIAILPASIGLALLPTGPKALLSFIPGGLQAIFLLVFLHFAFPASTPTSHLGSQSGAGFLRWFLPIGVLVVGGLAPLAIPFLLPAPLAAMQELRPMGAMLVTSLVLCMVMATIAFMLRGLRRMPSERQKLEKAP